MALNTSEWRVTQETWSARITTEIIKNSNRERKRKKYRVKDKSKSHHFSRKVYVFHGARLKTYKNWPVVCVKFVKTLVVFNLYFLKLKHSKRIKRNLRIKMRSSFIKLGFPSPSMLYKTLKWWSNRNAFQIKLWPVYKASSSIPYVVHSKFQYIPSGTGSGPPRRSLRSCISHCTAELQRTTTHTHTHIY